MGDKARVVYFEFDALDARIASDLISRGELPALQRLLHDGAGVATGAPVGLATDARWRSATTGRAVERLDGAVPVWEAVASAGRTVSAPDAAAVASASTDDDVDPAAWDAVVAAHDAARDASLERLDRGGWDLFATTFDAARRTGRALWALHDADHPAHSPEERERLGVDPLVDAYRRLDETLAAHLTRVGPDATVYVHLAGGMGPNHDGAHLLDGILHRLAAVERGGLGSTAKGVAASALEVAHRHGGPTARRALRRTLGRDGSRGPGELPEAPGPDAERYAEPWYAVPGDGTTDGGIRLNVIGRETRGVLSAGADADAAAERVRRGLLELVNMATGAPAVHDVVRSDGAYRRSTGDTLPDLFVVWNRSGGPIERVWSPRIGPVEGRSPDARTGRETPDGLLVATGPGIVPGRRPGHVRLVDVGVTVAAAAGVALPDVDGVPVDFLLPSSTTVVGVELPEVVAATQPPDTGTAKAQVARLAKAPLRRARGVVRTRAVRRASIADRLTSHVTNLAGRLDMLGDSHHETRITAEAALRRAEEAVRHAQEIESDTGRLAREAARAASIEAVSAWIAAADVPETLLVSVVMPTHDRAHLLPRAIGSVQAQTYGHWELQVVDDSSTDDTPALLAGYADEPRIHAQRAELGSSTATRNLALEACTGDVVVYLDDDNWFDPGWFKAVVWAFEQRPDAEVLYGARIVDDMDRASRTGSGRMPMIHFDPFDRERLERANFVDMGVIAHRRKHPEARFDADLTSHDDWDLFLRLTAEHAPLELPVVALYYTSDAVDRKSDDGDDTAIEVIRSRWAKGAKPPEGSD